MKPSAPKSLSTEFVHAFARLTRLPSPHRPAASLSAAANVLVVKLDAIGDFVLCTPFLRQLRLAAPTARIHVVTGPATAPLAAACPWVDAHAVYTPVPTPRRLGRLRSVLDARRLIRSAFPGVRFDHAFVPRRGPDLGGAGVLARVSGATRTLGFAASGTAALLDHAVDVPDDCHEAEANLALLRAAGAPTAPPVLEFHCPPAEARTVQARLAREQLQARGYIVLGVGASLPHKVWPAERFLALAAAIKVAHGLPCIAIGDAADAGRFPPSAQSWHNWAGSLSIAQSWALLKTAALFVGNDSAGVHLAAAAGCPCVVVSWDHAEADPADVNAHPRFAPHGVPHRTVHAPKGGPRAAEAVPLEAVVQGVEHLVHATTPRVPHP